MVERLQKLISAAGIASRRAAEEMIAAGRVTVNGAVAGLGDKADPETDEICVDGKAIGNKPGRRYYIMLHKPVGYVTTMSDEKGRRTVAELVADVPARVYPVGRLDINSEGLLLMTNDGDFANLVTHPSFEKEKVYRVLAAGDVAAGVKRLLEPMELDGEPAGKPKVEVLRREGALATLEITIHEGKNRQIRRMCDIAGLTVKRLTRVRVGPVSLGKLPRGHWRELTDNEVRALRGK